MKLVAFLAALALFASSCLAATEVVTPDFVAKGTINSATSSAAYGIPIVHGQAAVGFTVTGLTASGATLTVEDSSNGAANFYPSAGISPNTLTADGQYTVNVAGRDHVELVVTSTGSGTVTVSWLATMAAAGGNVGGFDSGSFPIQTATPANSSHSAGTSVGGLFSIPIGRTNGGGGDVQNVIWTSTGGSAGQLLIRMWDKNPTGTTCTDNTAFAESATDDQHLIFNPFTITPAAPASTTGDTNTYGYYAFTPPLSFRNQDGTASKNVYLCAVTVSTDTADENKAVYANAMGAQD